MNESYIIVFCGAFVLGTIFGIVLYPFKEVVSFKMNFRKVFK
jgi:hypothetical protein